MDDFHFLIHVQQLSRGHMPNHPTRKNAFRGVRLMLIGGGQGACAFVLFMKAAGSGHVQISPGISKYFNIIHIIGKGGRQIGGEG